MISDFELDAAAAQRIRAEIARANGNEVCFAAEVSGRIVVEPVVLARGHATAVLAAVRELEPGRLVLHNHPSGDLTPSDADLEVAASLYHDGHGLAIVDNLATELYVVVAPAQTSTVAPLDPEAIAALLAPGGPVEHAHPAYEDRPVQRDLARIVAHAYNDGGVSIVEAGTGVGKSIAYLIPAVRWAAENRERTIVSTNTINLQEQLVGKDLPFLRRALGEPFRFALVKGRHNYVSIRRARLALATSPVLFDDAQSREVAAIGAWLEGTREGSLQDLSFTPTPDVWDEIVSDPDVCLRAKCPHFEQCFYQRARRAAATADILVVNHHLLFSDIALRSASGNYSAPAVLPPYNRVILDEAHNVEDAATQHLGARVSRRGVLRALGRVERRGKGLLPALDGAAHVALEDALTRTEARRAIAALRTDVERARERALDFFDRLARLVDASEDGVVRLHDDFTGEPAWIEGPEPALDSLLPLLDQLASGLRKLRSTLSRDERVADKLVERLIEVQASESRLQDFASALRTTFRPGRDAVPFVRWIDRARGGGPGENIAAYAAPIEIGTVLREALFDSMHTTVLTSATLTTRDSFEFLRGRLGLSSGARVREAAFPSPFDFERQTRLVVPTDLPGVRDDVGNAAHEIATAGVIEDFARASEGGVFALFTSHRSLRLTATELRRRGAHNRWPLFVQGEAPRSVLLQRFAASGDAILLGVASFWEGVDVPGDALRGLIITKQPFKVPTEPLTAARIEAIDARSGNSFREFMLPHAALRTKQGFGRLIRTAHDHGVVAILDRRILEKNYGNYILASLPPAPLDSGKWSAMLEQIRAFYEVRRSATERLDRVIVRG